MAFTYDDTLLTDRDLLRLMIGDTVSAAALFSDEELDQILLDTDNDMSKAIGMACRIVANDPDRLMLLRDQTAGAFTIVELQRLFRDRANRWLA